MRLDSHLFEMRIGSVRGRLLEICQGTFTPCDPKKNSLFRYAHKYNVIKGNARSMKLLGIICSAINLY